MKQKPQTNELSKGMPGPIPAWQTEKNCAEADNAYGHEAPCLHDTLKNDERRNETAIDEDAQNAVERQEAYFLRLIKKAQAKMADPCLEKCEFICRYGDRKWIVCIYREECPEAFFCEYSMYHLLCFTQTQCSWRTIVGFRMQQGRPVICTDCLMIYVMANWHIYISVWQNGTNGREMATEPCGIGNGA